MDNAFVEWPWCSLEYEDVCLKAHETMAEAGQGMATYFRFYNRECRGQSLNRQTSHQVYEGSRVWSVGRMIRSSYTRTEYT